MVVRRKSDNIDKWVGLSTDTKPASDVGSLFIEEDTDNVYVKVVGEWVEFGGGDGGGNPFSEPVRILVDGTAAAPALNMGVVGGNGFMIQDFSVEAGGAYGLMKVVTNNAFYGSTMMFDTYSGMHILDGWGLNWYPLNDFDDLTFENFVNSGTLSGYLDSRFGNTFVLYTLPKFGEQAIIFRLQSEHIGGDNFNYFEIEAQAGGADYRIFPRSGGGGTGLRGLQIGITGSRLGFYGTTAIVKPTVSGSKASGAALVSLLTQLAALGLLVDGSSA